MSYFVGPTGATGILGPQGLQGKQGPVGQPFGFTGPDINYSDSRGISGYIAAGYYSGLSGVVSGYTFVFRGITGDGQYVIASMSSDKSEILLQIKDIEVFKKFQAFFFSQRLLKDDKKLKISSKCEKFIAKVIEQAGKSKIADGKVEINLSAMTNYFNE